MKNTLFIFSVLMAFSFTSMAQSKKYYLEPSISKLSGTIIIRQFYGPPNYGESPKTDSKEYAYLLKFSNPISVFDEKGNEVVGNTEEIQLVSPENSLVKYKNKTVTIEGTLFSAETGHHHTPVLLIVKKIKVGG